MANILQTLCTGLPLIAQCTPRFSSLPLHWTSDKIYMPGYCQLEPDKSKLKLAVAHTGENPLKLTSFSWVVLVKKGFVHTLASALCSTYQLGENPVAQTLQCFTLRPYCGWPSFLDSAEFTSFLCLMRSSLLKEALSSLTPSFSTVFNLSLISLHPSSSCTIIAI